MLTERMARLDWGSATLPPARATQRAALIACLLALRAAGGAHDHFDVLDGGCVVPISAPQDIQESCLTLELLFEPCVIEISSGVSRLLPADQAWSKKLTYGLGAGNPFPLKCSSLDSLVFVTDSHKSVSPGLRTRLSGSSETMRKSALVAR